MTERTVNDRRNWKAQVFPYDHFIPDESPECLYCLTEKQAEILRGIIEPLGWKTRWWSDTDTPIDKDKIEAFTSDLIRRLMMSCCGDDDGDVLKRLTPEGKWQISTDNGATWHDDTATDPRRTVPRRPTYPAPEGDTPRCEWADSIVSVIRTQFVSTLNTEATIRDVFVAMAAVLALIFGLLAVAEILIALTPIPAIIFAIGISAFKDAMTDEVWDRLRCNIFCHMDANGIGTQEQVDAIYNQIGTDETGVARLFLQGFVALLGVQGMINAANFGSGNPDADCGCGCGEGCDPDVFDMLYLGTIIDSGDNYVTIESAYNPGTFGEYRAAIGSGDTDVCCCFYLELLTGTPLVNQGKFAACGVDYGLGEGAYTHINTNVTVEGSIAAYDLNEPFTLKITFVACEE